MIMEQFYCWMSGLVSFEIKLTCLAGMLTSEYLFHSFLMLSAYHFSWFNFSLHLFLMHSFQLLSTFYFWSLQISMAFRATQSHLKTCFNAMVTSVLNYIKPVSNMIRFMSKQLSEIVFVRGPLCTIPYDFLCTTFLSSPMYLSRPSQESEF